MDKAVKIYGHILKEYLSKCFSNQQKINPIDLNKKRFIVKALFTASIIFLKNNPQFLCRDILSATNHWFKTFFAVDNLFSSLIDIAHDDLIKLLDDNICKLSCFESIDVPTLYEALLGIESGNEINGTVISTAKNYRNKLGSYYTPANLAKASTKKTIDTYFELNFGQIHKEVLKEITSISFADFSCGCGIFLIAIIDYFDLLLDKWGIFKENKFEILKEIALNISAFDVDCLALEVAKLNLLFRIRQPNLYKELSQRFIHANFLLHTESTIDEAKKKIDIFSCGFIYHSQLSLNKAKLKRYDIVLGNPPWEKIRFEDKNYYALYSNTIANNHFKISRTNEIAKTELTNVQLAEYSNQFKLEIEKAKTDLKNSSFFYFSNHGELNTYALFTNAAVQLKTERGVVGLILKSAIATSQANKYLFNYLTKGHFVVGIYDFINRNKIFNIDSRERFCFMLLGNSKSDRFRVSMNLSEVSDIETAKSEIELSYDLLKLLNPITKMLPNFSNKKEADWLLRISCDLPVFKSVYKNVKFGRIVHLTSHSEFISKRKNENNIPIYEGKYFNQFDGKFSGFNNVKDELRYSNKSSSMTINDSNKNMIDYFPESRYFINSEKWLQLSKNHTEKFMLAWRSLTSATNTRTCIATLLPFIPATQSVQFLTTNQNDLPYLAGLFNSVAFDFILKKKLSGIDLTQSVINQMPVPSIEQTAKKIFFNGGEATIKQHISSLVFSLLKHDARLKALFENMEIANNIRSESKFETIRKLDLIFISLYKLTDSEVEMVLSEFSKQYSKDDLVWFKNELLILLGNNAISPTISTSAFSPF